MVDNNYKPSKQWAEINNSTNDTSNSGIDYYERLLKPCTMDFLFQNILNSFSFKEVTLLPRR